MTLTKWLKRMTSEEQCYLPCCYHDYIGGSSTGAYANHGHSQSYAAETNPYRSIATMLSRLQIPVAICLDEYENLTYKVFGCPNFSEISFPLPYVTWSIIKPKGLSEALNDFVH